MIDVSHLISCILLLVARSDAFHSLDNHKSWKLWLEDHGHEIFGSGWKYDTYIGPPPQYHLVDQDHFDGTNINVWKQAYYVNDTFWKGDVNAPVFLCVGGEGPPLDGSVVVASPHCNIAVEWLQMTGAIMFAVEHRYYGCHNMSACPVTNFDDKTALKFLSSRQALGDLAKFHHHAREKFNLKDSNKWVSFGGSYPGMLAGWFRLKFPHLVVASVSSSAPVLAQVDMQGYNDVVAYAYTVDNNGVGGSQACHDSIANGHATIGKMLNTDEGRSQLAKLFKLPSAEWLKDKKNQRSFAGYGVAYFPAQSNDPVCRRSACNIAKICTIMTNTSIGDDINKLAYLRAIQMNVGILTPGNTTTSLPDFWEYQTCTEFGFYQTCEVDSKCFFTKGLSTLDDEMSFCTDRFGIKKEKVFENVGYTNDYYGGLNPGGNRILSPNGEVDPWHSLAIIHSPDVVRLPTLWVKGASHHAWTHPSLSSDQQSVIVAREAIKKQILIWLQVVPLLSSG